MRFLLSVLSVLVLSASLAAQDVVEHLQDVSVTISATNGAGQGQGSGVLITRQMKLKKDDEQKVAVNFCWSAAHVVDHLRNVRPVIVEGTEKKVIEYGPVEIVKELTDEGRKVGETRMTGRVVKWSHPDNGHDLTLIVLLKKNYVAVNTKFYLEDKIPTAGTELFHVGSLLGQFGANSLTKGPISQIGRMLDLDGTNSQLFDQSAAPAFPGSSGGGMFLADGANKGEYVGMLVRGAGETFNFMVPVRRMKEFAQKNNLMWALDEKVPAPSLEEVLAQPIEDTKSTSNSANAAKAGDKTVRFLNQIYSASSIAKPSILENLFWKLK